VHERKGWVDAGNPTSDVGFQEKERFFSAKAEKQLSNPRHFDREERIIGMESSSNQRDYRFIESLRFLPYPQI
jgi:hypothetical protein